MIAVMYHYVRPSDPSKPYSRHLDVEIFKKQLDFFQEEYGFVGREDFLYNNQTCRNSEGVILTFDDGFKDHYAYVMPELVKRNLWGLFYVPTGIYNEPFKLLGVHRIHSLIAKYGGEEIKRRTLSLIESSMLDDEKIKEFDKEIYSYSNYDEAEKFVRRLFNYYISYEFRDKILDSLMGCLFDEPLLFKEFYMSLEELKALEKSGSIVGSHTANHPVLSRLTREEQYEEIKGSFDFLAKHLEMKTRSFCYPYGYASSYDSNTLDILRELNVNHAFVFDNKIEGRPIYPKFEISRIDCNQYQELKS
jgi:peptidoglycan/xylan/chitin deacetylase (PgdA/CDA1 family)